MGLFSVEYDVVTICLRCRKPILYNLKEYREGKCPDCGVPFHKPWVVKQSKWKSMSAAEQEQFVKTELSKYQEGVWLKPGEVCRKKCKVCGEVWCYTEEDVKANKKNAMRSASQSLSGAMTGNLLVAQTASIAANQIGDKIIDFSKCPHCGSKDIRDLDESEWAAEQAKTAQGSTPAPAVSAADELKKFKELLDSGIITQEEFDAKKKQLLGL